MAETPKTSGSTAKRLFWIWLGAEVLGAAWFGWQIAKARPKPWARQPKVKGKR